MNLALFPCQLSDLCFQQPLVKCPFPSASESLAILFKDLVKQAEANRGSAAATAAPASPTSGSLLERETMDGKQSYPRPNEGYSRPNGGDHVSLPERPKTSING